MFNDLGLGGTLILRQDLDRRAQGTVLTVMMATAAALAGCSPPGSPLVARALRRAAARGDPARARPADPVSAGSTGSTKRAPARARVPAPLRRQTALSVDAGDRDLARRARRRRRLEPRRRPARGDPHLRRCAADRRALPGAARLRPRGGQADGRNGLRLPGPADLRLPAGERGLPRRRTGARADAARLLLDGLPARRAALLGDRRPGRQGHVPGLRAMRQRGEDVRRRS